MYIDDSTTLHHFCRHGAQTGDSEPDPAFWIATYHVVHILTSSKEKLLVLYYNYGTKWL